MFLPNELPALEAAGFIPQYRFPAGGDHPEPVEGAHLQERAKPALPARLRREPRDVPKQAIISMPPTSVGGALTTHPAASVVGGHCCLPAVEGAPRGPARVSHHRFPNPAVVS